LDVLGGERVVVDPELVVGSVEECVCAVIGASEPVIFVVDLGQRVSGFSGCYLLTVDENSSEVGRVDDDDMVL